MGPGQIDLAGHEPGPVLRPPQVGDLVLAAELGSRRDDSARPRGGDGQAPRPRSSTALPGRPASYDRHGRASGGHRLAPGTRPGARGHRAACSMIAATASGWLSMTACEEATSVMRALARVAMKRCRSGSMAWSWVVRRSHEGMVR